MKLSEKKDIKFYSKKLFSASVNHKKYFKIQILHNHDISMTNTKFILNKLATDIM